MSVVDPLDRRVAHGGQGPDVSGGQGLGASRCYGPGEEASQEAADCQESGDPVELGRSKDRPSSSQIASDTMPEQHLVGALELEFEHIDARFESL
ncbi:MAG: hypothetical protein WCK01_03150 [Candidatus Uhrbacteria bacterium]